MAYAQNLHQYVRCVDIQPKNPVYKERMYVNGFLGFISTTYKNELISHDGYIEKEYCGVCGKDELSAGHLLTVNPNGI